MTAAAPHVRILLVEDSDDDAALIGRALTDGGIATELRVVATEPAFRVALTEFKPDVVAVDWFMTGFSGDAAVSIARDWCADVPRILVSGLLGEDLVVHALLSGATDHVHKQRLEALAPAVRRALAEAGERRQRASIQAELTETMEALRGSIDVMPDPFLLCDAIRDPHGAIADLRVRFANPAAAEFMGIEQAGLVGSGLRESMYSVPPILFDALVGVVETGQTYVAEAIGFDRPQSREPGNGVFIDLTSTKFHDGCIVVLRDVTGRVRTAREHDRLAAVVEETTDGVVIADGTGAVTFANHAFLSETGLTLEAIVGRSQGQVAAEAFGSETGKAFESAIGERRAWLGRVIREDTNGTRRHIEVSVAPIRSHDGAAAGSVGMSRDITPLWEAEAYLALEAQFRTGLGDILRNIPESATLEQAAGTICEQLVGLPHIDQASVDVFLGPGELKIVGISAPAGFPLAAGDRLPKDRAALLQERLASGPWAWRATDDPTASEWIVRARDAGLRATAYGPLVQGDRLVGALVIGTFDEGFARTLVEKMPGIVSFSAASSALLARRLDELRRTEELRETIAAVVAGHRFRPVFQPIVDLTSGQVMGYEALTRFDSGQPPQLAFADAWSVGLGPELEFATLEVAVAAAEGLHPGMWLAVNVSARVFLEPKRLHAIVASATRPIVIEIAERERIDDYDAVVDAVRAIGTSTRLAVDGAGAGAANFGHIVGLRPDFVKIDMSLVRGVNLDLGRQAMVVGMRHFSRTAGYRLVAEGIETAEEARTLAGLGVEFGQGYYHGRPEEAGTPLRREMRAKSRRRATVAPADGIPA